MDAKAKFTRLSDAKLLDDDRRARLKEFSVTTVEELVGLLDSDPERLRDVLGLDQSELEQLKQNASHALPESTRDALDSLPAEDYSYGARDPKQNE